MRHHDATPLRPLPRDRRTQAEVRRWQSERDEWVKRLAPGSHFPQLFDHIPGLHFFAKNREGHLMYASRGLRARYSIRDEGEILGMTDFHLNPVPMAQSYVEDDRQLLDGEVEILERLELWWDGQGMPDWFMVTKLPLRNREGEIEGVMGLLRRPDKSDRELPLFQTVGKAVETIRRDFGKPIVLADLAMDCGQSLRQLQRRFRAAFGITPQEFLLKTRIVAAMRMLEETDLTAAEIGRSCGFGDASRFTQHFRKHVGMTPIEFRHRNS